MSKRRIVGTALAVFFFFSSGLSAMPLRYDESVDGDLFGTGFFDVLDFELGKNRIVGEFSFFAGTFESDFDPFQFTLPEDFNVVDVTFTWSAELTDTTTIFQTQFTLMQGGGGFDRNRVLSSECYSLGSGAECGNINGQLLAQPLVIDDIFDEALPLLEAGLYTVYHPILGAGIPDTAGGVISYEWEWDVRRIVPVAEPGTLALMFSAMFGLAASRFRPSR